MDKAELELELTKMHAAGLKAAIDSNTESLLVISAIAAALMVVATFKPSDLSISVKDLLTLLLFTIPFSLLGFLITREIEQTDYARRLGYDLKKQPPRAFWELFIAHWPWVSIGLIAVAALWMVYLIWH